MTDANPAKGSSTALSGESRFIRVIRVEFVHQLDRNEADMLADRMAAALDRVEGVTVRKSTWNERPAKATRSDELSAQLSMSFREGDPFNL